MKTIATLECEIEDIESEIRALECKQSALECQLSNLQEDQKRKLRTVALNILETGEYRLGGGDIRILELAIAKANLDKDQLGRVKLLAREFLFVIL